MKPELQPEAQTIFVGDTPQRQSDKPVLGGYVTLLGESFYRIQNFDAMEPFFMSVVSSSDHWLFVASTGGLSAGRGSAENSLFPYYTVDKITENSDHTGSKAILLVRQARRTTLWEPFSDRQQGVYAISRNLYKNVAGTALVFEEINHDLGLTYRYAWRTSEKFGFVRTTWLTNAGELPCRIDLLDGIQNLLPANVTAATQNNFSCLLDAYKRSELHADTGLGIFALSSTLTDLAEPSESLLATTVVQLGLDNADYLLSSTQIDAFRCGSGIMPETDVRGRRGAYFAHAVLDLAPQETRTWHLLADVQQDSAAVAEMICWLEGDRSVREAELEADIRANQDSLWRIVAAADGVQVSNNPLYAAHHFANVMFNVMRGGIFVDQYWIRKADVIDFLSVRNRPALEAHANFFAALPEKIQVSDLLARAEADGSSELIRLCYAYLPLTFSRRHGDPSRPWNRFAIKTKKPSGAVSLDYEGNWRDIFQNWEALAYSYPEFVENMIATFLNATTADGYNPYRITHNGVDWEVPEPGNPWANIGYWSDHQITYLHRLLEISVKLHPGKLQGFLAREMFSYAHVPYQIKPYADLLNDPRNTIRFNWELERVIEARQRERGTDGKLVYAPNGQVLQASLGEKLLTLLLAKLTNFVPEGGIWMNTQRPEWNDANNALVGKGLSVVTLCYLRQYLVFCRALFGESSLDTVPLHSEVQAFYSRIARILSQFQPTLAGSFSDGQRREMMDALGTVGSDYRWNFYENGFSGERAAASVKDITAFLDLALAYVDHSLRANERADHLFHAYNILHLDGSRASVGHLYEMLEGQVAILSSGLLSGEESLALLEALRASSLYQADRQSYILYPDRDLPGFLVKNCLSQEQVAAVPLFALLIEAQDPSLITKDVNGVYHFSGRLHNIHDVNRVLAALRQQPDYAEAVDADSEAIKALFEMTFRHDEFTGRSGTFFAYEGLGSIYWHMVAKLLLAAQETVVRHKHDGAVQALRDRYMDVRQGLSFNKTPSEYGAFPTDPYSHTPKAQGAKQPGMTGMVKEIVLTRQGELGLFVEQGRLVFDPLLFDRSEFLTDAAAFTYQDVGGQQQTLDLKAGTMAYSICQTPILLESADERRITVHLANGQRQVIEGNILDDANSRHIFLRDGAVHHLTVSFPSDGV